MRLTTHFHLVSRLRMSGVVLPLSHVCFHGSTETLSLHTEVCILHDLLQETKSVNYNISHYFNKPCGVQNSLRDELVEVKNYE